MKRYSVLLTNDDGFDAPGIKAMYDALVPYHDVIVIAPQSEQSGVGHAFTFYRPLTYAPIPADTGLDGFYVGGTPCDCVKFGIGHLLKTAPDLIVSGMNIGENSGLSGFYSGTVAAAREAAFWGIPGFAVSVCIEGKAFFSDYCDQALSLIDTIMDTQKKMAPNKFMYNINFPGCSPDLCRGPRVTWQSQAFFDDRYKQVKLDNGQIGYQVYGEKKEIEQSDSYDSRAILNNYIAITPLDFDSTATEALPVLFDTDFSQKE